MDTENIVVKKRGELCNFKVRANSDVKEFENGFLAVRNLHDHVC